MKEKITISKIRRIVGIIWCVVFVLFLGYIISCAQNERLIDQVEKGYVRTSDIPYFGFLHGYKAPYNKGNVYYLKANYEKACECYKKSLKYQIPKYEECKVRVNYALALVAPLERDKIDKSNVDEAIQTLEYARSILLAVDCATDDTANPGHDFDAQTLKDEIDAYIEELRQLQQSNSNNSDDSQNSSDNNSDSKQNNNDSNSNNNQDNQDNKDNQDNQDNQGDKDNHENQDKEDNQGDKDQQDSSGDNKEGQKDKDKQLSPEEQKKQDLREKYREIGQEGTQERNEEMNQDAVQKDGFYKDIYW